MSSPPTVSTFRARYTLALLLLIYVVNFVDRQVLVILMEPIKHDLGLTDTQLGLLSGLAFAIFYATFGIPLARVADRHSRRNVIAICLTIWSVVTALCGFAQNFAQLLVARMFVAIGEAGGGPPSHSMIADLFPFGKRATALAIYACGVPLGVLFGMALGGWLNEMFNWRVAFAVVGAPGVVLAILFVLTVKEPAREASVTEPEENQSALRAIGQLWKMRSYRNIVLATAAQAIAGHGFLVWNPGYFIRTFHISTSQAGLALGLTIGLSAGIGTLCLGYLADRLGRRRSAWYGWLPGLQRFLTVPFYILMLLAPSYESALLFLILPAMLSNAFMGPVLASVQTIVPTHMRATASAFLMFVFSLVGMGLGPFLIGALSDLMSPFAGASSLRWAMMSVLVFELVATWRFYVAGKTLEQDLEKARL